MTDLVRQKFKINISGKKVLKLMKENALLSTVRRKRFTPEEYNRMRKNKEEVPENLLKRNFFALESDKKYVSDLTYLFGKECVKYLSLIEDLFNAEIVAWKISDHPDEQLCEETLDLLAAERNLEGAIFHTDQGSTYLSPRFKEKIKEVGMTQSCSARGICWDNAAMESANGILKTECLYNKFGKSKFKNRQIPIDDVVAEIGPFIEYYNNERPKKSLGGLSPVKFREQNPRGTYLMVIKD
jgi:transposase InsO family protein